MNQKPKLCIDCKHCEFGFVLSSCHRIKIDSLVDGKLNTVPLRCEKERAGQRYSYLHTGDIPCGKEAKYFEPKPPVPPADVLVFGVGYDLKRIFSFGKTKFIQVKS